MGKLKAIRKDLLICCAILGVLVLAVYVQTLGFEFVNYDDNIYVYENPYVKAGLAPGSIRWALGIEPCMGNWHPLTWFSLMADSEVAKWASWVFDVSLGKQNAGVYHATNVVLHLLNTCLVLVVFLRMTGSLWRSAFVAALFAVHPMHVESVAWVTERKDLLSTLFWLLTLMAYASWVTRPEPRRYLLVVAVFAAGLMAKPMLVSLPIVLLLVDLWPLSRWRGPGARQPTRKTGHLIVEKLPLLALAAGSCLVTLIAQAAGGGIRSVDEMSLGVRASNALVSYVAYIAKMVWPANMAAPYPHPLASLPVWHVVGSAMILAGITFAALRAARSRPYLTVGWLWYVVTLLPVIGLLQVGATAMADRYTYVPYIGLFIIVAWGLPDLLGLGREDAGSRKRAIGRGVLGVVSAAVIIGLALVAYRQTGHWCDSVTLHMHALRVTSRNAVACNNLGMTYLDEGEYGRAIPLFSEALRYHPGNAVVIYNLGNAYREAGNETKAVGCYKEAIRISPHYVMAYNNLGVLYLSQNKLKKAVRYLKKALEIDPKCQSARGALQVAEEALGQE